jgi:hypothetical protein
MHGIVIGGTIIDRDGDGAFHAHRDALPAF